MTTILHIETSSEWCSVAVSQNNIRIDQEVSSEKNAQSSLLTIMIDKLLHRNNLTTNQLNAIAVSKGPGSYTGLRIGVSTAKGLAFALDIPLISVDTMYCIAKAALQSIKEENTFQIAAVTDARRMEVYVGFYNQQLEATRAIETQIIDSNSFEDALSKSVVYFAGSGTEKCQATIAHPNARFISNVNALAEFMVEQAHDKYTHNQFEDLAYFEPFYLKEFYTTVSAK